MTDRRSCGRRRASQSQTRWCLFGIMTDIEREIHDFSTSVCSNGEPSSKLFFQSCICKHRAVVTSADEVHERFANYSCLHFFFSLLVHRLRHVDFAGLDSGPGVWRPSGPRMCFHPSQRWGGLTGLHEWEVLYCWGHRHGTVLDPTIICGDWPLPVWSVHFRPASLSQRFTHAFPISGSPRMRSDWPQNISCPRADWHTHTERTLRSIFRIDSCFRWRPPNGWKR